MNIPPEAVRPPRRLSAMKIAIFLAAITGSSIITASIYDLHGKYVKESISDFGQLPTQSVQALSFEFKGVVADYLFFKTLTFLGQKIGERLDPTPEEWELIYQMLLRITDLDARFWDPYVFAEMILAWQAGMFEEANQLLLKATKSRPEDYQPLYFIGFNYFYFKKDPKNAAPYLRAAAQLPDAPGYLKALAARVSLYGNQTAIGIAFLENLIKETHDPQLAKYMTKRLVALKMINDLEQAIVQFSNKFGHMPDRLADLVSSGVLPFLPNDPYGGEFVLLKNGKVYTTSKLVDTDDSKKPPTP